MENSPNLNKDINKEKYDHQASEAQAQAFWQENNTYSCQNNPGKLYPIDTPPPTVSGSLHIGHIFSYTQTDIIARYKRMMGHSVFYPMGFDDNGLPTERFVEKKNNIIAHNLTRTDFINLCLRETIEVEKTFQKLWERLGLSVDWSLMYSTIDERTRIISQLSCIELYKKGYLYRKEEPAIYCTTCRTSVAQAELDDAQVPSTFNTIRFRTESGQDLLIATTRPELLPSCVALFYNPKDERYKKLEGQRAIVPVYGFSVPIFADEAVSIEKGTGLVMCCTFGDRTDIEWFKKYKLPYKLSIGLDGKWVESTGVLAGLRVAAAREKIIQVLKESGELVEQKQIMHSVNVHERCKREVEFITLPQWFIKILPYKQQLLDAGDKINWYPSFMKSRYKNWVENLNWDWCISRQRFFGIPFPAWHCSDCGEIIMANASMLPLDPQETKYNKNCPKCSSSNIIPDTDVMDTWNTSSLTPYICLSLYGVDPKSVFEQKIKDNFIPMSMRPQAHDIIRTWAFYTITKTWMHNGEIPWENIVISGHVLSAESKKISKSQGNNPLEPENLLAAYPADAIRYWTASGSLGHDVAFSDNQLKIGQKLIVKLWNAFKFAGLYIEQDARSLDTTSQAGALSATRDERVTEPDLDKISNNSKNKIDTTPLVPSVLGSSERANKNVSRDGVSDPLNQWILHKAALCFEGYKKYFEQNEFGLALDYVEKFFWADFCDNYLELIKDRFANQDNYNSKIVNDTRQTLYDTGLIILQLYSPFVPHITEHLYSKMYKNNFKEESIHQTRFEAVQITDKFIDSAAHIELVIALVNQVRKLKSENKLSLKTDLETLKIYSDNIDVLKILKNNQQVFSGITRSKSIEYISGNLEADSLFSENSLWIAHVFVG